MRRKAPSSLRVRLVNWYRQRLNCPLQLGAVKVHLVDGTFELFRAYYSAPAVSLPDGREVGAARGFARSMLALTNAEDVTHVAVAFDHVIESFRNRLYPGYKTGEGIEPALFSQFPLVEQVTRALGIVAWPMVEFEADDALASAAQRFAAEPAVEEVVICSPDKDLCQCAVEPKVVLWDRIRDQRMKAAQVVEKFGVEPGSIPDYLALVGDSADGIPGVPRWGKKSAAQVLARYTSLEEIPPRAELWDISVRGAKGLAEQLAEHREAAALYKQLATLRRDVPLDEELSALRYQGATRAGPSELETALGDARLLTRVPVRDE